MVHRSSGFADSGPYWRILPAIGAEAVSVVLLVAVLVADIGRFRDD
ncbi:hypothetical protein [Haladaptatus halobius]|nr:hypothetical protein [Haladaptatus halobius]